MSEVEFSGRVPEDKVWWAITTEQKIERWENVLRVLNALTPEQRKNEFSMRNWWSQDMLCATTACAAGWCGLDQWFQSQGFMMKIYHSKHMGASWAAITDVPHFFGIVGSDIFYDIRPRPVEVVIQEVSSHLQHLKTTGDVS